MFRISPEFLLKMFIIGDYLGFYEFGKQFRNEGIDLTYDNEFITVKFYEAFADSNYFNG